MDETGVEQRGGLGSYLSPKLLNWLMLILGQNRIVLYRKLEIILRYISLNTYLIDWYFSLLLHMSHSMTFYGLESVTMIETSCDNII